MGGQAQQEGSFFIIFRVSSVRCGMVQPLQDGGAGEEGEQVGTSKIGWVS